MNGPCVLALLLVAIFSVSEAGNLKGSFGEAPKDGAACKWYEGGSGTKSQTRSFRVVCNFAAPKKGKKKEGYECTYSGNPHNCKAYNKNQADYYKCLAEEASENAQTGCSHGSLTCESGKFKKCDDTFGKQSALEHLLYEKLSIDLD